MSSFLVCPEGFYGSHCLDSCNCETSNFVCHVAHGCVCRQGFTGTRCDAQAGKIIEAEDKCKKIINFYKYAG